MAEHYAYECETCGIMRDNSMTIRSKLYAEALSHARQGHRVFWVRESSRYLKPKPTGGAPC